MIVKNDFNSNLTNNVSMTDVAPQTPVNYAPEVATATVTPEVTAQVELPSVDNNTSNVTIDVPQLDNNTPNVTTDIPQQQNTQAIQQTFIGYQEVNVQLVALSEGVASSAEKIASATDTINTKNAAKTNTLNKTVNTGTSSVDLSGVETRLDTIIANIQPDTPVDDYNSHLENINGNLNTIVTNTTDPNPKMTNVMNYTDFLGTIVGLLGTVYGLVKDKKNENVVNAFSDIATGATPDVSPNVPTPPNVAEPPKPKGLIGRGIDKAKNIGGKVKSKIPSVLDKAKGILGKAVSVLFGKKAKIIALVAAAIVAAIAYFKHKKKKEKEATETANEMYKNMSVTSNVVYLGANQLANGNTSNYTQLLNNNSNSSAMNSYTDYEPYTASDTGNKNGFSVSSSEVESSDSYNTIINNKFDMQIIKEVDLMEVANFVIDEMTRRFKNAHKIKVNEI